VQRLTELAVDHFDLRCRFAAVVPTTKVKPRGAKVDDAGGCYDNGIIEIRLHRSGRPNQPLSESWIKQMLAHEIAHLRYPTYHRRQWANFRKEILDYWRNLGDE
jgi:hypothetical protein